MTAETATSPATTPATSIATSPATSPLQGVTVVELGHSVAAPFAGQILADLGARVIKIENPERGDDARNWGPPFWNGAAVIFQSVNRNKESAAVNLKDPEELEKLRDFIATRADVVIQNMRAGLVSQFGIGAELRARNPRLIYCNLGAFGATGPYVNRPGYDPLMQAFGGIMSVTGNEGEPPVRVGVSLIDQGAGMWSVIGILAALTRRAATGEGCTVDTSLFETALAWVNSSTAGLQATGKPPGRRGTENPGLVPYRVFEASDGYLMIAAGNDNLFKRLAGALGKGDWLDNERFATNPMRVENRTLVNSAVQEVIGTKTVEEWIAIIEPAGVPVAPLQTIDQVFAHPQTQALGILQQAPDAPDMKLMGLPLSFNSERPALRNAPPKLGAQTDVILGPKTD
ncbi:MAG: CoA transferase [Hyphomicrobiales bacterium]|nr:CoA transferase [Hyphomicrobiales bacterium]